MRGNKSPSTGPALARCHRHHLCLHTSEERLTGATDDPELQLGPAGKLVMQGDIFQSWNISILPNYEIVELTCLGANKTLAPSILEHVHRSTHIHVHTHTQARAWGHRAMGSWGHGVMGPRGHGVMGPRGQGIRFSSEVVKS